MSEIDNWNSGVKLVKLRDPEPTNHPDPRMHLVLADMKRMFPQPEKREPSAKE